MTLYEFQVLADRTAKRGLSRNVELANFALGLAGEAGETVDYLKKVLFHGEPMDSTKLTDELGDVLWYVAALASAAGLSLEDIAAYNSLKLLQRYPDGFENGGGNRADNQ